VHEHAHLTSVARQEHRRLARRVSSADEGDVLVAAEPSSAGEAQYETPRPSNCFRFESPDGDERAGGDDGARPDPRLLASSRMCTGSAEASDVRSSPVTSVDRLNRHRISEPE
jgi:hypothetical protein